MAATAESVAWWRKRRARYNLGLVASGILAFIAYAAIFEVAPPSNPEAEITAFTIAFQAVGYVVMMGVANICYSLGPVVERRLGPADPRRFREVSYALGCAFSFALPVGVPVMSLLWR